MKPHLIAKLNNSQAYGIYYPIGVMPTLCSGEKRFGGLPTYILKVYEADVEAQT